MKKVFRLICMLLTAITLSACAGKPPSCDEAGTQDLIKKIYYDNVAKTLGKVGKDQESFMKGLHQNAALKINSMQTDNYDETSKKFSCTASISLAMEETPEMKNALELLRTVKKLNDATDEQLSGLKEIYTMAAVGKLNLPAMPWTDGVEIENTALVSTITYTSGERSNDKGQKVPYVSVKNIRGIVETSTALLSANAFPLRK